jgi:uncharacterized protein YndB with AHSA1/START domain
MLANDETIEACPTDVVRASAERVWEHLVDPAKLDWVANVIERPAARLRVGDRVRFSASLGLRVTWDVLAVEPVRQMALDIALPFGMANHMTIVISSIDAESCRVTFN